MPSSATRRLTGLLLHHRRLVAAVCAGLAVLVAVSAVRQPGVTETALVATDDLPSGHVLAPEDVEEARIPADAVPAHALVDRADVEGLRVGGPVRAGEVLTDVRVLGPGTLAGRPAGTVVSTVRVADPAALQGLRVGDRVDVVAVEAQGHDGPRAEVVAAGLEVAALDPAGGDGQGSVSLVARREEALELARVALEARLSVVAATPEPG